jgi:hypothetical protein
MAGRMSATSVTTRKKTVALVNTHGSDGATPNNSDIREIVLDEEAPVMRVKPEGLEQSRCDRLYQALDPTAARFIDHQAAARIERQVLEDRKLPKFLVGLVIERSVPALLVNRLHQDNPGRIPDRQRPQDETRYRR